MTITEISPREHTVLKLGRDNVALLKVHCVLPKLMATFRWRIMETGVMLFVSSCATLLQQRSRFFEAE